MRHGLGIGVQKNGAAEHCRSFGSHYRRLTAASMVMRNGVMSKLLFRNLILFEVRKTSLQFGDIFKIIRRPRG